MSGDIKVNRIKARHKTELALLGDVTKMAQEVIPKLHETAVNRVERRNMIESLSVLGRFCRARGFDPTRTFQHVANFDTEIWTLILDMFAKYDEEGNFMDDGLLYRFDEEAGCIRLHKPFFYALLEYCEAQGIPVDMREKIKLN